MSQEAVPRPGCRSLPALIAWLSVCLLAASCGSWLGPGFSEIWAGFGLFGLASALGLDFTERRRAELKRRAQTLLLQDRFERNLSPGARIVDLLALSNRCLGNAGMVERVLSKFRETS